MTKQPDTPQEKADAVTFDKEALLASDRYANRADLLAALLEEGRPYTLAQADAAIENYLNGGA
jgi:hypothetical protein